MKFSFFKTEKKPKPKYYLFLFLKPKRNRNRHFTFSRNPAGTGIVKIIKVPFPGSKSPNSCRFT